jgi:hypothetical protein
MPNDLPASARRSAHVLELARGAPNEREATYGGSDPAPASPWRKEARHRDGRGELPTVQRHATLACMSGSASPACASANPVSQPGPLSQAPPAAQLRSACTSRASARRSSDQLRPRLGAPDKQGVFLPVLRRT